VDVSVIIVNWNTNDLLLDRVRSLSLNKSFLQMELIVVDNGSRDGPPEDALKQFPQVRLIRNKTNVCFAKPNNIDISQGEGRHVCLINSDVFVRDMCIDRMCANMDLNPSVSVLGPR
jgi:GT2 family glycosyltransferase